MRSRNDAGFTLIEVIVVAGIIAILAGILVPLILKEIDEARKTRAAADVRAISNAILILRKDTGQWPVSSTCTPASKFLTGAGAVPPLAAGWDITGRVSYDLRLSLDDEDCWPNRWKGPYIAIVNEDPWGNAYVTNADAMTAAGKPPIWILSAGPDGTVETAATDTALQGDDVGVRIQ